MTPSQGRIPIYRDRDTIALDVRVVLLVIRAVHLRPDILTPTAAERIEKPSFIARRAIDAHANASEAAAGDTARAGTGAHRRRETHLCGRHQCQDGAVEAAMGAVGAHRCACAARGAHIPRNEITAPAFTKAHAKRTGRSPSAAQDAAEAKTLGDETLQRIAGTSLDTPSEVAALAAMAEQERQQFIERAVAGETVSALKTERMSEESNTTPSQHATWSFSLCRSALCDLWPICHSKP
jgi:hypothetical protein